MLVEAVSLKNDTRLITMTPIPKQIPRRLPSKLLAARGAPLHTRKMETAQGSGKDPAMCSCGHAPSVADGI